MLLSMPQHYTLRANFLILPDSSLQTYKLITPYVK
jgi:hypothetical protein